MVIQSFSAYSFRFKKADGKWIVLPARNADKNIIEVSDADLEVIRQDTTYQDLLRTREVRELDKIPAQYLDQGSKLAELTVVAQDAQAKIAAQDAIINDHKNKIAQLQAIIDGLGGPNTAPVIPATPSVAQPEVPAIPELAEPEVAQS